MIHAKGVLAFVATTLLLCAPGEARVRASGRELLQSEKGRQGKDKSGNIIPETQPDGASTTDVKTASCTACTGTCESCNKLDIEAGVTIDNCGDVGGKYTCDVSVSNALMPWKAGGGISWGRITGGACDAAEPWDTDSVKKEEIVGGVKLYSVVFPDAPCSSAELCIAVHDGSLDPCKDENYPERTECPVQTIRDGGVKTSNQLCKICQQTITVNKPKEASCEDPFGCTGPDQCFGAGCGLVGIDGKLGPCECNKLNGEFQNTDDAFCQSKDNYADAYSCTDEACKPADAGGEATGCVTTVSTVVECGDQFACTADACYVDVAESTPACSGTSVLDCIQADTGCVFKTQDDVCEPLKGVIGCGAFNCGDDSVAGSVAVGGYANNAYTGCFGVPETASCAQPECGSPVCDLSFPDPAGCGIDVAPQDDADCKEEPDNFCTSNTCVAEGVAKGTCKDDPIDNNERECVSCTSDAECTEAVAPCETGVCFGSSAEYPNTCDFEQTAGCVVCPNAEADDGGCPTKPCQTATCTSGECTYSADTAADGTACTVDGASGCCSSGTCNSNAATPCGGGGGGGPPSSGTCTGVGFDGVGCGSGECCRDGACETCQQCYDATDCTDSMKSCCEYNICVLCPPSCESDVDCSSTPGTCCIMTDEGSGGQGVCLSEGCPKPNPCPNADDTDNDELYDCVDPCDGDGAKDTCPGTEASHPSYFTVSDCSTTATVTYKRAPQLKTNNCDPDDAISWVTIYWLQDGMANGSMCTKVNGIPADGEVTLANVPCGQEVYVLAHDGQYPSANTQWQTLYDKGSAGLILDGGCTSQDVGNKCPVGSVTINCDRCEAE